MAQPEHMTMNRTKKFQAGFSLLETMVAMAVLLGVERAPGRRQGWYTELGFAGGVRAAVGWRMRWFPKWWT